MGQRRRPGAHCQAEQRQRDGREDAQHGVGRPAGVDLHVGLHEPADRLADNQQGHGAANALLTELWDNPQQHTRTLYRGTRPGEGPGIKSYSEKPHIAKKWAKKYGGEVVKIKAPVGLQMSRYISSGVDLHERQWIVDETDPRNKR